MKRYLIYFFVGLSLFSCISPVDPDKVEIKGDPKIVAEFDFAKAWEEATPTYGEIVELDSLTKIGENNTYVISSHSSLEKSSSYELKNVSGGIRTYYKKGIKGIINDLGDTIYFESSEFLTTTGTQKNLLMWQLGLNEIFKKYTSYGGVSYWYLTEINGQPYDLMKTMRSTYNSIKYLQTIYPDSLIPFDVFDNEIERK